jgi:hypothetical protein
MVDHSRFDASVRAFAASGGRRDAIRSLSAVGLSILAAVGLRGDATGAGKRRKKHRSRQRGRTASASSGANPPVAPTDELDVAPVADGLVEAEARKKSKPGPTGPTGPTGATGATGPTGPAALTDVFENAQLGPNVGDTATLNPTCPNVNSKALGGGFDGAVGGALSGEVTVNAAFPTARNGDTPEGFQVEFTRTGAIVSGNIVVTAFVKCTI